MLQRYLRSASSLAPWQKRRGAVWQKFAAVPKQTSEIVPGSIQFASRTLGHPLDRDVFRVYRFGPSQSVTGVVACYPHDVTRRVLTGRADVLQLFASCMRLALRANSTE